jgi:hypothetical protein
MPPLANAVVIFILPLASAYASSTGMDNSPIAVTALQAKADQAQPRDRCFLYAELVSQLTDLAGRQFNSGDSVKGFRDPQDPATECRKDPY